MRKIVLALVTTASAVAVLFSYRTSTEGMGPVSSSSDTAGAASTTAAAGSLGATAAPAHTPRTATPSARSSPTHHHTAAPARSHPATSRSTSTHRPSPTHTPKPKPKPVLVDGPTVNTRYGPVQVQLRVEGGRITAATALKAPSGNARSDSITQYAVPKLSKEVLAAQSAKIDAVSGATYTSQGYISSLQSAVDKAHLA